MWNRKCTLYSFFAIYKSSTRRFAIFLISILRLGKIFFATRIPEFSRFNRAPTYPSYQSRREPTVIAYYATRCSSFRLVNNNQNGKENKPVCHIMIYRRRNPGWCMTSAALVTCSFSLCHSSCICTTCPIVIA